MDDAPSAAPIRFHARQWIICLLLALATVQCVRSVFFVNVSLLDLRQYINGAERTPFQSRVAMIPLLRWAGTNRPIQRVAGFLEHSLEKVPQLKPPPERVSPEKLACILAGMVAMLAATAFLIAYGRRHFGRLWWMPATLMLVILFATYGARYETPFWYPYDLPHFALFGMAAVLLLRGRWALAFCVFLLDLPMRETSIYLVPVLLALGWHRGRLRQALGWAAAMAVLWLPWYLYVWHRFAHNPTDTGVHGTSMFRSLANPLHWPQVACAFGYLVVPFVFGWRDLAADRKWFVYGALPCLFVTGLYGIWYETRIWDEWMIPAAVIFSEQAIVMLRRALPSTEETQPA